jgi:hypothetical protein
MTNGGFAMSRQGILDDPASSFPQLHQFLGGYFHEDWHLGRDRWEAVVDDFVAESPQSLVTDSAGELGALLDEQLNDVELAAVLEGLGCSVDPSAFNLGAAEWLSAVGRRLRV